MAAGILPKPGTNYGPCERACAHIDCNCTRRMAKAPCGICGKRIGYDTPFYERSPQAGDRPEVKLLLGQDKPTVLEHALCAEELAERQSLRVAAARGSPELSPHD